MERRKDDMWRNYYKEVLHKVEEFILFFDIEGKVINWNISTVRELGYDGNELSELNIRDIFRTEFSLENHQIKYIGKSTFIETVAYRKNETCCMVKLEVIIIGEPQLYGFCIAKDIQEEVEAKRETTRLKEELRQAMDIKNDFIANITHELRTPLNGMKGLTSMLLDSSVTRDQEESLRIIATCCSNMERLINDLLDFTKLQADKFVLEENEFSFRHFVKNIVNLHASVMKQKELFFDLNISNDIPERVIGDEMRLTQILNNLLNNAVKFTSKGGITLEISKTHEEEQKLELFFLVADTGIGIGVEEKEKLFKSFSQVDASITRKYGGTGLGLSICKELVERMGGSIDVESEKGKGSNFFFTVQLSTPKETVSGHHQEMANFYADDLLESFGLSAAKEVAKEGLQEYGIDEMEIEVKEEIEEENLEESLKRLSLCLDLGSWEKAEEFVHKIKVKTKEMDAKVSKKAFQLELAIRKENIDKSTKLFLELETLVKDMLEIKE